MFLILVLWVWIIWFIYIYLVNSQLKTYKKLKFECVVLIYTIIIHWTYLYFISYFWSIFICELISIILLYFGPLGMNIMIYIDISYKFTAQILSKIDIWLCIFDLYWHNTSNIFAFHHLFFCQYLYVNSFLSLFCILVLWIWIIWFIYIYPINS